MPTVWTPEPITPPPSTNDFLLKQDGDFLLLQTGDKIIISTGTGNTWTNELQS